MRQLWVAAKSGGFHFDFDEKKDVWICNSHGETLIQLLNRMDSSHPKTRLTLFPACSLAHRFNSWINVSP
jgi:frataxin-like iron-binding protein CyaY